MCFYDKKSIFVAVKRVKIAILLIFGAIFWLPASGQKLISAPEMPAVRYIMNYTVVDGDTVFLDELDPVYIHPKNTMSKKEWKKYYKTVYNFSRAYPYALFVSDVINRTDSLFNVDNYSKYQQERYLEKMKENLLADFTDIFKGLTLKQGLMMIRLIDREVGMTPYYIIKDYLGGANATFWQGVAKLFKGNLKRPFDKYGEDKELEELALIWYSGEFRRLYKSIFWSDPPEVVIPPKYLKPLP